MRIAPLLCVLAVSGCVDPAGIEDGSDDTFAAADGKADAPGLTEAEASAVFALASSSTEAVLRDEVGLSARVAKNVAGYVAGKDGRRGTADDQAFDSLDELDAVPYVGANALAALVAHARAAGLVRADALGRHDVSVLFPLSAQGALWPASTPANGGELLPRAVFAKIGMGLFPKIDDAAEYDALRVVAVRFDPCFRTSLAGTCQAQIRLVFQTVGADGANDGSVHALYNLSDADFKTVVAGLRAIAPAEHRAYRPLGTSPALVAQGVDGAYGKALEALVVAHAGAATLAPRPWRG